MKDIYLDYAATTPTAQRVIKAMKPYWHKNFGIHQVYINQVKILKKLLKNLEKIQQIYYFVILMK